MIWSMQNAPPDDPLRIEHAANHGHVIPTALELEAVRPAMIRSAGAILRNREDIEDAVQEGVLRLLRSGICIDTARGTLAAYACTTVRRVAFDLLRRRGTVICGSGIDDDHAAPMDAALSEPLDAAHVRDRLRGAVDRLPDAQRVAFLLVMQEGLPHAEAARELRISQETLRARLHRARKQLRERLKDLQP